MAAAARHVPNFVVAATAADLADGSAAREGQLSQNGRASVVTYAAATADRVARRVTVAAAGTLDANLVVNTRPIGSGGLTAYGDFLVEVATTAIAAPFTTWARLKGTATAPASAQFVGATVVVGDAAADKVGTFRFTNRGTAAADIEYVLLGE